VVVQACNRDTGPGLLLALLELARCAPDATVAVFPTDHYVRDEQGFNAQVARAFDLARRGRRSIVLLGMTPTRIEPAFGHLHVGSRPAWAEADDVFRVATFIEKPDPATAERIMQRGGLWNTFVMVFRLDTMLALLRRRRPADYALLSR